MSMHCSYILGSTINVYTLSLLYRSYQLGSWMCP